jgi:hypothetical protein
MLDYSGQRSALAINTRRFPRRCGVVRCRVNLHRCRIGFIRSFRLCRTGRQHRDEREQESEGQGPARSLFGDRGHQPYRHCNPPPIRYLHGCPAPRSGHTVVFARTLSTLRPVYRSRLARA